MAYMRVRESYSTHESPLRGLSFVTRKITDAVARIERGLASTLQLGNLEARRDWGYAKEYVDGFLRTLQADAPGDFVFASGRSATVRDFVFECVGFRKKPATIRRYVATIGRAHRAAGVADPVATETVRLALKEMGRMVPARQSQARGLVWRNCAVFRV